MTTDTRCRTVIVDDHEDSAEILGLLLGAKGHDVEVHHQALAALDAIAARPPDVVILDLGLPDLDGLELCARIRARLGERTPTMIAVTGWAREEDRERTREAGFDAHLVKPVDVDAVLRAVADACARAA